MGKQTKDATKNAGKAVIKNKTKPTRDMFEQAEQAELARRRMWLRENANATPHEPDTKKAAKEAVQSAAKYGIEVVDLGNGHVRVVDTGATYEIKASGRPFSWIESFERDVAAPGSEATEKTLANGEVHTGWFNAEGQLHGRGNITFPNGHSHNGTFEKGRLVVGRKFEGTEYLPDQSDGCHYLEGANDVVHADGWSFMQELYAGTYRDGTFDEDGELEGKGEMCRATDDGPVFEYGTFEGGKLHGWGYRTRDYSQFEPGTYGEFHHGELAASSRKAAELAKVAIQEAADAAKQQAEECPLNGMDAIRHSMAVMAAIRQAKQNASANEFWKAEEAFHAPIAKPAAKPKAAM